MKGEKDARRTSGSEENKGYLRLFGKLPAFITLCALSYLVNDDEDGKVNELAHFGTTSRIAAEGFTVLLPLSY
jgi:hypothetical protein